PHRETVRDGSRRAVNSAGEGSSDPGDDARDPVGHPEILRGLAVAPAAHTAQPTSRSSAADAAAATTTTRNDCRRYSSPAATSTAGIRASTTTDWPAPSV